MLWEWLVVPFGLKNAPPYFRRRMDYILRALPFCRCYIDDIIISSRSVEEHLLHLEEVFKSLREAGLNVHPGKCVFGTDNIDFLGHHIQPTPSSRSKTSRQQSKTCLPQLIFLACALP